MSTIILMSDTLTDTNPKKNTFIKRVRNTIIILAFFLVTVYVIYGAYLYNTRISSQLTQTAARTLDEVAAQQQQSLASKIRNDIASIKSIAYSLVVLGYEKEDILDYLNVIESYYNFNNITILDANQKGIVSSGLPVQFENDTFFNEILLGKTLISLPQKSFYSEDTVVLVATPIFEFGKIAGLVAAEFSLTYLNDLLHPSFNNNAYSFILDDSGTIIAKSENTYTLSTNNVFNTLRESTFLDSNVQDVIINIIQGKTGTVTYTVGGQTRIADYRPLPFTGWSIMLVIPEEVLFEDIAVILAEVNSFNMKLILGIFATMLFIILLRTSGRKAIKRAAYYDNLTGIPNLTKFKKDVQSILKKYPYMKFTMVQLDIVNFKSINDFYDFTVGDKVLKAIANTGKAVPDKIFEQCRIGRDDFLLFGTYELFKDLETTRFGYEAIFRSMIPEIENHSINYRYGRYEIEDNEEDINTIVNKAILAHSHAKNTEGGSVCDYSEEFTKKLMRSTEITNKQKIALTNREFKMVLQPKCHVSDGRAVGAEALVRWQESDGKMIFPNDFIPLFESNGFIVELDMYMLERVCEVLSKWEKSGLNLIPISVNFSRRHLEMDNFAGKIEEIANRYGVDKSFIEIELTEGVFLENEGVVRSLLNDLHDRGFKLSMDDFGSGYSSLGLLHSLPVDVIKLDRSFVTSTDEAIRAAIIVESVAHMTQKLGIPTVAEGVETLAQVEFLRTIGCEIIQGYYYSKPIPVSEFEQNWLTSKTM